MVKIMEQEKIELLKKVVGDDVEIISSLKGGMMNEAYIVKSKQGKFVYYISTAQANEMVDRPLEKKVLDISYNLGLTSKNIYFDFEKGIKINKFIEGDSINHIKEIDFAKVANLFFKYHSSKETSGVYYDPLNRLINYRKEAETHTSKFDDEFYELYELIMSNKEFLLNQEKTLAHNDAQRSNIIRDNDGNYFLIDFEFAADNDPVYDIGTFGNDNVSDGVELLKEYEKISPLKDGLKRYALWRIDISIQWYLVAIIKHYRGEGALHGFNFLDVAHHFLLNALEARKLLK